jgi:tetratricopeptide (TPR) repeat protein
MLLPFKPLQGEKKNVESALRDRLATEIEKYKIPASVLIRNIDVNNFNNYPATPRQAERFGRPCRAQLIIFGTTEEGEDGLLTATRFRFLDIDSFKQTQLVLNQEAEIDTIQSLSSIAAEGVLSEGIEENIKILFGLIAYESGNDEAAVALISEAAEMIEEPLGANWNMVLADSYTNLEDYEQAIRVYDQILAQDSTHNMAWEKRALLNFKLGNYPEAARDLTVVIEKNPEDTDKRVIRGLANTRMNNLQDAKEDYQVIRESNTRTKGVGTFNTELNTRIKVEEERKQGAEKTLRQNPKDTSALRIRAEAARNLGEYELAGQSAASLLAIDRKNVFAWRTLQDVKPKVADTVAFNATIQRMLRADPRLLQQVRTIPAQQLQIQQ